MTRGKLYSTMQHWMMMMLFLFYGNLAVAQNAPVPEAEVKSIFLFHFTSFVDWPSYSFSRPTEPLVIGILGTNPFGSYLENAIRNEKKGEHPLTVKYFSSVDEIGPCHILFIVKTTPEDLNNTLATLKGRKILTVGDSPYFISSGGMIRFFIENHKVRLQVNMEAVKKADLVISSKLLRVADVVNAPQP